MNLSYEAPQITPILNDLTVNYVPQYDKEQMTSLMLQHGSVLMIAHEQRLRLNYQHILSKFQTPELPCQIIYPYKVNQTAAIAAILHEEGAFAGISSDHELHLAQRLKVSGEKIVISGPVKSDGLLLEALHLNALIQIDHIQELNQLEQIASLAKKTARISLQISGLNHRPSQFGFDYHHPSFLQALAVIQRSEHLQLVGLYHHHHEQTPTGLSQVIESICKIGKQCQEFGLFPQQLFLGGGFPAGVPLKQNHAIEPIAVDGFGQTIQRYKRLILSTFGSHTRILIAPGRLLVEDAIDCACKVMAIKPQHQGIDSLFLSAGTHLLPHTKWYRHPIYSLGPIHSDEKHTYRLCGPSTLHHDILRQNITLPPLCMDDIVIIQSVGAYNQMHAAQAAQPQPAMILMSPNGPHLIKKSQQWQTLYNDELIPSHCRHAHHHFSN